MSNTKKLAANSILYTISGLLSKCLSFFLMPIYTMFLTSADLGTKDLILSFNSVFTYLILLSLDSALMRFYVSYKDDKEQLKRLYSTIFWFVLILSGVVTVILFLFKDVFMRNIFGDIEFYPYVALGLVILVIQTTQVLYRRYLESSMQGKKQTVIGIVNLIATALLTILFIAVFKIGVLGVLLAILISSLFCALYSFYDLIHSGILGLVFDADILKRSLKYSIYLVPHNLSGYIANFFGRAVLNMSSGLSSLGLFSISVQITSVIETFQDSVGHAYRPWLNETLQKEKDFEQKIKNISEILITGYSFVYLAVALASFEIIAVMTSKAYIDSWKIIPILTIAYSINSLYYFYIYQCMYYPETNKKIFIVSILGSLSNIVAGAMLIPMFGIYGNVIAVFASIVVRSGLFIWIGTKHKDIGYNLKYMIYTLVRVWLFIGIGILPSYIINATHIVWWVTIYKVFVFMAYSGIIYYRNRKKLLVYFKKSNDKQMLQALFAKIKTKAGGR